MVNTKSVFSLKPQALPALKSPALEAKGTLVTSKLSAELSKHAAQNPHLHSYLRSLKDLGSIQFVTKLSRDLGKDKTYNYIYPVSDSIFIHVYKGARDAYGTYHPIEPRVPLDQKPLLRSVEELVARGVTDDLLDEIKENRSEVLMKLFNEVVKLDNSRDVGATYNGSTLLVGRQTYVYLRYEFMREKVGLGDLEPLIRDPYIEDISCDGVGPIFVEHKIFQSLRSTIEFASDEELDYFVVKLCERIGKPVSLRRPIVDATLPDGSRINVVFGRDVSRRGSNFTIRKFSATPLSITQLIRFGTLDARAAAYLWMLLESGMSIFVCGETASGKTTTLNAMVVFIKPTAKIISIEDTPEVQLPHPNWVREVTRRGEGEGTSIELFDLLKSALRQRPNYIIVGEIRGKEGNVAFQAMQTGHPVLSTFHAANIQKLIQRLTGDPINIPPAYIDNLNAIIFQNAVDNPKTGRRERRVTAICEMVGIDPVEKTYSVVEIFSWDPATDKHLFRGVGNSYLLEYKIAPMKGLTGRNILKIYDQLELRTQILQKMVDNGIFDYHEVFRVVSKIYSTPYLFDPSMDLTVSLRMLDKLVGGG